MDWLSQSFVHDVVHLAQVNHQFFLGSSLERAHFAQHLQEVGGADFAGVELAEKDHESIPLLD